MTADERPGQPPRAHRLQPPLRPPEAASPTQAASATLKWGSWLALAVLVLLGAGVVFVLPGLRDGDGPPRQPAQQLTLPANAPAEADARRQAEQTLQRFLRLQAELKLMQVPDWAPAEWQAVAQEAGNGDRLFGERRFSEADQSYSRAVAGLETLKTARPARLAETLAAGREALGDDDGDAAQRYFEQALLIDTDNEEAQTGLARARVRSRVLQFMAAGAQAEDARQLQAARAAYQQALQLDAVFAAAQQGLTRVEAALAARSFNAAMNEALAALAEGRFDAAGAALDRAATIDPYATAMVDTRERLRLARQQAAVDALRRDAAARAQAEDWLGAVERYRRVLKIDAAAGFAREGVARAEQRAKLNRQFDHYLDDPTRLFSAEPLANAEQLLDTAGEAPTDEPRLASKIESLRVLVRQARQPLPVMLQSDGETDVVIYHVGRLGRFVDRRLQLPPGTYTAVGSRTGYRDVRRMFEVRPGQLPSTVEIRCEEPV